jgi:hypothetical protein
LEVLYIIKNLLIKPFHLPDNTSCWKWFLPITRHILHKHNMHHDTMTCFGGAVNRLILLFTSLHVSASRGHLQVKYKQSFLKSITPTTDLFLGYTVYYFKLCYVIYYNLKFDVKTPTNVLKITTLYKNVVLLKLAK